MTQTHLSKAFSDQPVVIADPAALTAGTPAQTAAAVATTGATNSSPYGFTGAAQADAVVAAVNALRTDVIASNAEIVKLKTDLTSTRAKLILALTALKDQGITDAA